MSFRLRFGLPKSHVPLIYVKSLVCWFSITPVLIATVLPLTMNFVKVLIFRESRRFLGTGWTSQGSGFASLLGKAIYLFPENIRSGFFGAHTASYPMDIWSSFLGKLQSTPSTAESKNSWSDTSSTLRVFKSSFLTKFGGNFTYMCIRFVLIK